MDDQHVRAALAKRLSSEYDDASITLFREGFRKHLGASVIGEPCEAVNWFQFRWIHNPNPGGRMFRLYQRGHREEPFVFSHLRTIGFTINELDPTTGKQWRLSALHGHFGGSCDGRGYLPPRYEYDAEVGYEVKTANDKQFKICKRDGVAKWRPKYARQMDVYGRAWGIDIFVFVVVNKNDDDTHIEFYRCNPLDADLAIIKAERVITSQVRPPRISEHPSFAECRYCDFHKHCHSGAMPSKNCRSCVNAVPHFEGTWSCSLVRQTIPDTVMVVGCNQWKSII